MKTILWGLFVTYCVSISWLYFSAECAPRDCYCVPPAHLPNEQNLDLGKSLIPHESYLYSLDGYSVWCGADKCHIYDPSKQEPKTKEKKITNRIQKRKKYYSDVWCIKGRDWSKCDR